MGPQASTRSPAGGPTTAEPVLSVRDLAIALPPGADRALAVQRIGFDVHAGETVCLLGESGSGKSVIAQAVMGLLPPGLAVVEGSIALNGQALRPADARATATPARTGDGDGVIPEPMTALKPGASSLRRAGRRECWREQHAACRPPSVGASRSGHLRARVQLSRPRARPTRRLSRTSCRAGSARSASSSPSRSSCARRC